MCLLIRLILLFSHRYRLSTGLLVVSYVMFLLPCILVILLLPILCFCLPCIIRVFGRLADPMRGKGATQQAINVLTSVEYEEVMYEQDDAQCIICLTAYEVRGPTLGATHCIRYTLICTASCAGSWFGRVVRLPGTTFF